MPASEAWRHTWAPQLVNSYRCNVARPPMTARPDIRFCTTSDGVRLAMALYGSGPPLVRAGTWLSHIEDDALPGSFNRPYIDAFASHFRHVTYDTRGTGLSDRHVEDVSLDAWVRDLEAVVDALALERFCLYGVSMGVPIAVRYAARHPERVERMVLLNGFATSYLSTSKTDPAIVAEAETLLRIAQIGWGRKTSEFRKVFATRFSPRASPEQLDAFDRMQQRANTPEMATRTLDAQFRVDVKADARSLRCPVLVMHVSGDQLIHASQGRSLAGLIAGARFVPLPGDYHLPLPGDPAYDQLISEALSFLGADTTAPANASLTPRQREVLQHVAAGHTDKLIARQLGLSPRTVEMHVAAALRVLGATTRAEAVHRAMQQRLLEIGSQTSRRE